MKIRIECSQIIYYDTIRDVTEEEWEILKKLEKLDDAGSVYNTEAYEILQDYLDVGDRCDENPEYSNIVITKEEL